MKHKKIEKHELSGTKKCLLCIMAMVISFLPGIFGFFFTPHGESNLWYNALVKSNLTPDGWVFSVAWTILYALLGLALYWVIVNARAWREKITAYTLFLVQIVLNAAWSFIFFGMHLPAFALVVLLTLFIISVWMARVFAAFDRRAAYCVIPYLLWMMFAFYMNAYIVLMN